MLTSEQIIIEVTRLKMQFQKNAMLRFQDLHRTLDLIQNIGTGINDSNAANGGSLISEEYEYTGSQVFTTTHPYAQVYSVEVRGVGALSKTQYSLTLPDKVIISDQLESGDYIVILYSASAQGVFPYYTQAQTDILLDEKEDLSNKQNSLSIDGTGKKYPTVDAVNAGITSSLTPDATSTVKGKLKLAGDLSGTADLPTVPGLTTKVSGAGSGTINYIPKWNSTSGLGNSNISDNGTLVNSSTDMNVNGIFIGRGVNNLNTNVIVGSSGLGGSGGTGRSTSLGQGASGAISGGNDQTTVGYNAIGLNQNGGGNVGLGSFAGYYTNNKSTGLSTISSSTFIGYRTSALNNSDTNQTVIGYDANGIGSNSVVLGNDSVTKTALKGNVLIGQTGTITDNGTDKLQVNGSALVNGLKHGNSIDISNTNLDNLIVAGFYSGGSLTNAPVGVNLASVLVEQYTSGTSIRHQLLTVLDNAILVRGKIFSRVRDSSGWSAWSEILTSASGIISKVISATTYTIINSDNNTQLIFTNSSPITLTIPTGLTSALSCEVLQQGTGQITFTASGTTLQYSSFEYPTTYAQNSLVAIDNVPNLTETYHLFGQLTSI